MEKHLAKVKELVLRSFAFYGIKSGGAADFILQRPPL